MSLLSICQNACNNVGVNAPASIIGSTDPAAVRLLQLTRRTLRNLASRPQNGWVSQIVEHVFIANGTSDYALPSDFAKMVDGSLWDRSRYWQMRGVMSAQQWQMYKSSVFGRATIERRWRIRLPSGASAGAAAVFSIDPAISSTDTSSTFVFEYVSNNLVRDAATLALEEAVVAAGGSGYALGNSLTLSGGTSTTAAVILVTGVSSTGAITAAEVVIPGVYTVAPASPASVTGGAGSGATFTISTTTFPGQTKPDFTADTDVCLLDEGLIELGVIWRLQQRLGLAYLEEKEEYDRQVDQAIARDGGTSPLHLVSSDRLMLIGPYNVPETGFGGVTG